MEKGDRGRLRFKSANSTCERTKGKPAPASEAGVDSVDRCVPESRATLKLCSEHVRSRSGSSSSSAGSENERQKRSRKAKPKKERKKKKKNKKKNTCDLKDKPKKRKRSLSGSPPRKWYPTADTVRLSASVRTECEEEARIFAEGFGRARDDWNSRIIEECAGADQYFEQWEEPTRLDASVPTATADWFETVAQEMASRRARREEEERRKWHRQQKQARQREDLHAARLADDMRADLLRREELMAKARARSAAADYEAYNAKWEAFGAALDGQGLAHSSAAADQCAVLTDAIAWPVKPDADGCFDKAELKRVLLESLPPDADVKRRIRDEQLRWHPDKFVAKVGDRLGGSQAAVLSIVNHLAHLLNEFRAELG